MPGLRIVQVSASTSIGPSRRSPDAYLTVARVVPSGTSAQMRSGTSKGRTVEKVPAAGVKMTSLKPVSPVGVVHCARTVAAEASSEAIHTTQTSPERFVIDSLPTLSAVVREARRTVTQRAVGSRLAALRMRTNRTIARAIWSLLAAAGLVVLIAAVPQARSRLTAWSSDGEAAGGLAAEAVAFPGGEAGIGFDDLRFLPSLGRVLVPAGRSGNLDLVDPSTGQVEAIGGFSSQARYSGGHGEGMTSADFGRGFIFAVDRTARKLVVVDAATHAALAQAKLASSPDYVRWVEPIGEVWVTQPDQERIEVFALPAAGMPAPVHTAFIPVVGGPESLVVDVARHRAYTHLWRGATVAVDLAKRAVIAEWPNRCRGSRGIALDAARGFLFVGCTEGKAVVLDVAHDGAV